MTTTTTRPVTLPSTAVERLRPLLAAVDAAATATLAAADAADAAGDHEAREAGHREWERARQAETLLCERVVRELRRYL